MNASGKGTGGLSFTQQTAKRGFGADDLGRSLGSPKGSISHAAGTLAAGPVRRGLWSFHQAGPGGPGECPHGNEGWLDGEWVGTPQAKRGLYLPFPGWLRPRGLPQCPHVYGQGWVCGACLTVPRWVQMATGAGDGQLFIHTHPSCRKGSKQQGGVP